MIMWWMVGPFRWRSVLVTICALFCFRQHTPSCLCLRNFLFLFLQWPVDYFRHHITNTSRTKAQRWVSPRPTIPFLLDRFWWNEQYRGLSTERFTGHGRQCRHLNTQSRGKNSTHEHFVSIRLTLVVFQMLLSRIPAPSAVCCARVNVTWWNISKLTPTDFHLLAPSVRKPFPPPPSLLPMKGWCGLCSVDIYQLFSFINLWDLKCLQHAVFSVRAQLHFHWADSLAPLN